MGEVFSIRNFNLYVGRYSRTPRKRTPEQKIGWYLNAAVHERLPIQAIRNRESDTDWPAEWRGDRNTRIAIDTTLDSLKAWQVFRPKNGAVLAKRLAEATPSVLRTFQREAREANVSKISDLVSAPKATRLRLITAMSKAVGKLSALKSDQPMLGSKVMNFLLPEFFPVWDTEWIKKTALVNEDLDTLPDYVDKALSNRPYSRPAKEYARYVTLMVSDLKRTDGSEYRSIEKAFVRSSEVDEDVVWWHFNDLAPILFEFCLLGKHNA